MKAVPQIHGRAGLELFRAGPVFFLKGILKVTTGCKSTMSHLQEKVVPQFLNFDQFPYLS